MARAALFGLIGLWGLWLYSVIAHSHHLVGWTFIASDLMIGLGLLNLRVHDSDAIRRMMKQVGLGFLVVALADLWWTLAFPTGEAQLGDTLGTWVVYAVSGAFTCAAAWLVFVYVRSLLGLSNAWLWTALGIGLGVGIYNYSVGAHSFHDHTHTLSDFVALCLNTALAAVGAFSSTLFALMGIATRGGSVSRWLVPTSLGFSLILIGDVLYTALGDTYIFGSLADWCYIVGNSMFFLYFLRGLRSKMADPPGVLQPDAV